MIFMNLIFVHLKFERKVHLSKFYDQILKAIIFGC